MGIGIGGGFLLLLVATVVADDFADEDLVVVVPAAEEVYVRGEKVNGNSSCRFFEGDLGHLVVL